MKRSKTKNVGRKKSAVKKLNVIAEDVHTNKEVDSVGIPDSSVIKAHDDIAMDEEEDVSFDPPLHSTAVYTDADEPLEKDLNEVRPREEQSLSSSVRKLKSPSTSSKRKTAESSEDHTAQENTVIEKTKKKTPTKTKSSVQAAESSRRFESTNKVSEKATGKLHTPGKANRSKRKIDDFLTSSKKTFDTKHGQPSERIVEEVEGNVSRRPSQAKKRRKKISEVANKGEVDVEDNAETPGQTKKHRRKVKSVTPNKAKYQVQTECSASLDEESSRSQTLGQAKKRRRKTNERATPNKKKLDAEHGQPAERIEEEEEGNVSLGPSQAKKRRKKISEGATQNKAKYQVQTDVGECSASLDEESSRLPTLGQAKKRRRKTSEEAGSPKSKTVEGIQNTLLTSDSGVSGSTNTVPIKVWRSKEMPRSSRDLNELDVVLSEFEEIVEEYRDAIDSSACKKAVDMFYNSFKEQLTTSIADSQKLKNLKRQNTKLQLEIGKMRKELIRVREELIENEPKLKKLQKEYAEQEEQKSCLNKAHSFLNNLRELQNNYMLFKAQHPETQETYGMSSLAALLQQSDTIFRVESHFQNINAKLQCFVDQQKKKDVVPSS